MQDGESDEAKESLMQGSQSKHRKLVRSPLKESEKMWVTATTCLILFLVVTVQVLLIIPYFVYDMPYTPFDTFKTLAQLLIPFNIGAALILSNYFKCVTMDAGSVPIDWQPPSEAHSDKSDEPRYCRPCKSMKPPRTHHCRTCRRCTLRMDHHCPWIANCVGQRNYASFIRFLAAVDVTCAAHLVMCGMRTADYWWVRQGATWRPPSTTVMVILVLNFCLCVPTFLLVGSFSIYHFWCLCTNTTTIEGWEKDKVETMISKRRIEEIDYPFDLGVVANIQSVLGRSPLQWCIPSLTRGDGVQFDVTEGVDPLEQYYWPPKDPRRTVRQDRKRAKLSSSGPFTYGNDSFNPNLRPSNSAAIEAKQNVSEYPPWHPNFGKPLDDGDEEEEEEEADAAQASGVDLADSCVPPVKRSAQSRRRQDMEEESEDSGRSSSEEESARTMTRSRVRRGSEGYEVRPKRYEVAYAAFEDGEEDDDDNERDELGFDDYNNEDEDDRAWDWQRRQEEEDKLREMLEEDMRASGPIISHDPPADWQTTNSSILLPSQVMRRRSQWQDFIADSSKQSTQDQIIHQDINF